jgi:hypothetical protein
VTNECDPRPELTLNVKSTTITPDGGLSVILEGTVKDALSALATEDSGKVQKVVFTANGEPIGEIADLPARSPGHGQLPWEPSRLDVAFQWSCTIPNAGGTTYLIRAQTTPNAAGNSAWADVAVVTVWKEWQEGDPTDGLAEFHPEDPERYAVFIPVVASTKQLCSSPKGWFEPFLLKMYADHETAEGISATQNGVNQTVKPLTFSPEAYYVVGMCEDRPRIFVVTVEDDLPEGMGGVRPENLHITEDGGEFTASLWYRQRELKATVRVFKGLAEEEGVEPPRAGAPLTRDTLMAYYKLMYGPTGLKVLYYYEQAGNHFEVCDLLDFWCWDVDVDWVDATSWRVLIQIDEAKSPIDAAHALWDTMWEYTSQWQDAVDVHGGDLELLQTARARTGQAAIEMAAPLAAVYYGGVGIVSEAADLVMTVDEVTKGNYPAAIGFLPWVPATVGKGVKVVNRTTGLVVAHFPDSLVATLRRVCPLGEFGKASYAKRLALIESDLGRCLNPDVLRALVRGGTLPPPADPGALARVMKERKPIPAGMHNPQAHHELPWVHKKWFAEHGLDVNDPAYGRWVEGNPKTWEWYKAWLKQKKDWEFHQNWSADYNEAWRQFIRNEVPTTPYTRERIVGFLDGLRPDFPSKGIPPQ